MDTKIDTTNAKVDKALSLVGDTNLALEDLELKVEAMEGALDDRIKEAERRIQEGVKLHVKDLVVDQLRAIGFDPDMSAGGLSVLQKTTDQRSYASALASAAKPPPANVSLSKQDRQEEKFWTCRRSLRLWPVKEASRDGLECFLKEKLRMSEEFIREDLGETVIRRHFECRLKTQNEVCVTFESKQIRDAVQAQAPNLANFREEACMRIHLPDHLKKDFRALMFMSYHLKKKHTALKRNIKFDEDELNLFMDLQLKKDGPWSRVRPDQARKAAESRRRRPSGGPPDLREDDLVSLLDKQRDAEEQ